MVKDVDGRKARRIRTRFRGGKKGIGDGEEV
jgi:hypothetical protein